MKRYVRPNTPLPESPSLALPVTGEFDISDLLDKGGEILRREITNLMVESSGKKLSPNSAKDLVAYLKLLSELKIEQQKALAEMSDEELEKLNDGG